MFYIIWYYTILILILYWWTDGFFFFLKLNFNSLQIPIWGRKKNCCRACFQRGVNLGWVTRHRRWWSRTWWAWGPPRQMWQRRWWSRTGRGDRWQLQRGRWRGDTCPGGLNHRGGLAGRCCSGRGAAAEVAPPVLRRRRRRRRSSEDAFLLGFPRSLASYWLRWLKGRFRWWHWWRWWGGRMFWRAAERRWRRWPAVAEMTALEFVKVDCWFLSHLCCYYYYHHHLPLWLLVGTSLPPWVSTTEPWH